MTRRPHGRPICAPSIVTRAFGIEREVRAVDDVSLSVARNEIYGLAGESSCGKRR